MQAAEAEAAGLVRWAQLRSGVLRSPLRQEQKEERGSKAMQGSRLQETLLRTRLHQQPTEEAGGLPRASVQEGCRLLYWAQL